MDDLGKAAFLAELNQERKDGSGVIGLTPESLDKRINGVRENKNAAFEAAHLGPEAANETAKTGKVVGVLADALNWAGISEDYFNEELKWDGAESNWNRRIMNTLSVAYNEAALAFQHNNKKIIAARENQIKLDETMATLGETISKIKNTFLAELSPVLSEVADKFVKLAPSVD